MYRLLQQDYCTTCCRFCPSMLMWKRAAFPHMTRFDHPVYHPLIEGGVLVGHNETTTFYSMAYPRMDGQCSIHRHCHCLAVAFCKSAIVVKGQMINHLLILDWGASSKCLYRVLHHAVAAACCFCLAIHAEVEMRRIFQLRPMTLFDDPSQLSDKREGGAIRAAVIRRSRSHFFTFLKMQNVTRVK